jgi:hypothetical protein
LVVQLTAEKTIPIPKQTASTRPMMLDTIAASMQVPPGLRAPGKTRRGSRKKAHFHPAKLFVSL